MATDEGTSLSPATLREYVMCSLIPHEQVIYAPNLGETGLRARAMLNGQETLLWVKDAAVFTKDRAAGRRW